MSDAVGALQPPIDERRFRQLVDSTGNDAAFIAQVAGAYIEDTARMIDELRAASASGTAPVQRRICHSLKSSSLSLGAARLAALLQELEQKTARGERGSTDVETIAAEFERVAAELSRRIGADSASGAPGAGKGSGNGA